MRNIFISLKERLMNTIIPTGKILNDLKVSTITLMFQCGTKSDAANYCRIVMVPAIEKPLVKVLTRSLSGFLEKYKAYQKGKIMMQLVGK